MRVGVIGAGAWGTALGIIVARGGSDVTMWSYDGNHCAFDGVEMPDNLAVTSDMARAADTDALLVVTPGAFFRETIKKLAPSYKKQPIIICTKGAECSTGDFMSEILQKELPDCTDFGVLSGPQFAAEVAQGAPTGSTLAGTATARRVGAAVLNKLYLSETDDIIGTQLCGVGKNAVALICGYNSVNASENERAMMLTRAWDEVVKMGLAMGANMHTFLDLCGIGDLFLSATSETSRNFSAGMAIARGEEVVGTVEGIYALCGLIRRAKSIGVDVPALCEMQRKLNL